MQEQIDDSKIFQFLFMELVYSFQNMAIMQLGKIVNPVTSKVEKNLPQAKATIDMLRMLKEKTKNNLSPEEEKLVEQVVLNLQLNYVDEVERDKKEAEKPKSE
ncbi:MAG: DUF1844 domain-containing protein [Candidatus Firestonebacteria bacterium]